MHRRRGMSATIELLLAEHRLAVARARALGRDVLHAPYCTCRSTWTEDYRDPNCEAIA